MKIYAYVILAGLLVAAIGSGTKAIYNAGRNDVIAEQAILISEAKDEAVEKARQEWENTAAIAATEIVVEERIVERVRIVVVHS